MKHLLTVFSFFILLAPVFVLAQYQPLVGIPGVSDPQNFDEYLQSIYAAAISLAALLAVIKIVIAGVKWMTTDIVTSKSDAKKDIEGAVFGLLIILGAVLILYIINPNIGDVDLTFAPPPIPDTPEGNILNTQIADCQSTPETCTFEVVSCQDKTACGASFLCSFSDPVYDCTDEQAQCLGTFAVSQSGKNAACLTDQAAAQASLADIAAANCPQGESCSAAVCDSDNCEKSCQEAGGLIYDRATNVCVISEQGTINNLNAKINDTLAKATLSQAIVNDDAIISQFNSETGAAQTYYLAKLPGQILASGENTDVIATLRDVCEWVAELEKNSAISVEEIMIEEVPYAGCARP